jgi:O-acetyl-ADP-ribose deacetylase (regulator of RNase III)
MTFYEVRGNIFNTKAKALVNTVNCVGVMGKGIALEFKRRYPKMYLAYKKDCEKKLLEPGKLYYYPVNDLLIINVATKKDWKNTSEIEWIESALNQFAREYSQKNITSLATPLWGVESGKLDRSYVRKLMRSSFSKLGGIDIELYDFDPNASDPLFENLKDLVNSPVSDEVLASIGLPALKIKDLVREIKIGSIKSMFNLSSSGLIGNRNIEKLYNLLSKNTDEENSTQLFFI